MLTGVEVAGLVFGAIGLIPIFKEAYKLARVRRQGSGTSDTTTVANEIRNSESSVTRIACDRLKDLIIQLQHGLLIELQRGGRIYNPASLVTIIVTGRSDAFTALSVLAQRLATAMPIDNLLGSTGAARYPYKRNNLSTVDSF
ncbi:hypothetical protein GLAREA_00156 [Glarea lozoyensis ATCC 20868]|uniref:Uncharacterized protein n=1 Tax=Glarea lozoyensis (strain ATCC 20868 / MF5171) TaxID=1116229 RepID=S3DRA0_GLAL2|nr:uncharacterized protein GLAREA_00156 [Glarea lozoyensis ATCC 20868]EPE28998.1 hypothetical protein GLAREA_00156 [Glarea lozoyensis ATCC 20868]